MKKVDKISENKNYTAVNIGNLNNLADYSFQHPINKQEVKGKVFLKDITNATGTEISFQLLPPKTELSYFHYHQKNEETYVILKGAGELQVDDDCFSIQEGSVVRIAPEGKRGLYNSSDETMIYMVIQSKAGSLEEYSTGDGKRVEIEPKWNK